MDCMIPICKYVYLLCSKQSTFNILLVAKVCLVLYYVSMNRQYSQHHRAQEREVWLVEAHETIMGLTLMHELRVERSAPINTVQVRSVINGNKVTCP